jgi:branched-chain amino acid aminotransferase
MAKGFTLSVFPWVYLARYQESEEWTEEYREQPHAGPEEEEKLGKEDLDKLLAERNSFPDLPLVNYSTQYGMSCFEGLKAFPQPGGGLKLFRPDENAKRMTRSMKGLMMPGFPEELFTAACIETVRRNRDAGFTVAYDPEWEKDNFVFGHSVYIRPFSYSEPGIGLGLSSRPWVVIVTTPVGSYFRPGEPKAVTTDKVRATPGGSGWIKCSANYVIPTLVKKQAEAQGYMEAIFLDARSGTYVEEGSSCNIFFYLKNGSLVTPALEDTVLPGINRMSVLSLAEETGVSVEERRISIDEVLSEGREVFVTGTAAGIAYIDSITHKGKTVVYNSGEMGELTRSLQHTLKGIQYGAIEDRHGWMVDIA